MARWTQNISEVKHLVEISNQIPIGGIAVLTLNNGLIIEGVLRRTNQGNNAGQGGWQYYGELEIETKDRQRHVIDYLDIKNAKTIWNDEIASEYEKLGLITIVRD